MSFIDYIIILISSIYNYIIILIHNSGKISIKLLTFNLTYEGNTNGGELVQLLGGE